MKRIFLIGNGPSSDNIIVRGWRLESGRVFRINHWSTSRGGAFGLRCDDWFVGEHSESWLPVVAAKTYAEASYNPPRVWLPGLNMDKCEYIRKQVEPWPVNIQRETPNLPAACRWVKDQAPMRPTTGSLALAVAVSLQPDELYICGIDLYQHPAGSYGSGVKPPDYRDDYAERYLSSCHGNHSVVADLRYIRSALEAFKGKLICVGSVLKKKMSPQFTNGEFIDG